MSTKIKRALFLLLAFAVLCAACSRKEETAKEENPKTREQMALAEKYLGEQKYDEAIEALLEAVELDPEDVNVYLKLSEIYADQEMDMEAMENPMFCLTNKAKMNGASLLLQEDIRKQIGECLGSDYFVIPSSVHEVLILPDNGIFQVPELNAMVQEVNETQVERQEQLSDKVQFCDKKTAVMENAERRETRLEKEKAAEKAEVKGGIHGKLEKAKAEIKAKEADKVPKNKSKDLAAAL